MKIEWIILLISALTDAVITGGTGLTTAMVATKEVTMPSNPVWLLAAVGGLVSAARTIQQALKQTPESSAKLKGEPPPNG
jgi:hypothetical protein